MNRLERLNQLAQEQQKNLDQANAGQGEQAPAAESIPSLDIPVFAQSSVDDNDSKKFSQNRSEDSHRNDDVARYTTENAILRAQIAELQGKFETVDKFSRDRDAAAEAAAKKAAELEAAIQEYNTKASYEITADDIGDMDPDTAKRIQAIAGKIAQANTAKLKSEFNAQLAKAIEEAKEQTTKEVFTKQTAQTEAERFEATLVDEKAGGRKDMFEFVNSQAFKDYVMADEQRVFAFKAAAGSKSQGAAKMIISMVKGFEEANQPSQRPRSPKADGSKTQPIPSGDDGQESIDHDEILRMVRSGKPELVKKANQLMAKAMGSITKSSFAFNN